MTDIDWSLANCIGLPTDLFFPSYGQPPPRIVKDRCAECPIRVQCLDYAVVNEIEHGIWGGTSARHRRKLIVRHRQRLRSQRPL